MKFILRGKELENCRIIKQDETRYYIEYSNMGYTQDNSTNMYESRGELIKQYVREWVKIDELVEIKDTE